MPYLILRLKFRLWIRSNYKFELRTYPGRTLISSSTIFGPSYKINIKMYIFILTWLTRLISQLDLSYNKQSHVGNSKDAKILNINLSEWISVIPMVILQFASSYFWNILFVLNIIPVYPWFVQLKWVNRNCVKYKENISKITRGKLQKDNRNHWDPFT